MSERIAWLVWVRVAGLSFPQIWYSDSGRFVGSTDVVILAKHKIGPVTGELDLDAMAAAYPAPAEVVNAG